MKSKLVALVSKTVALAVGRLAQDVPEKALRPSADDAAPDEKVPRDSPTHAALFANSGLSKPIWGLLRAEDVVR